MLPCESVNFHLLTRFWLKTSPEESASRHVENPNPQYTASGPRGEVQWLSGGSKPFEIGTGFKFFVVSKIPQTTKIAEHTILTAGA